MKILKILNPLIAALNFFTYCSHLENQRNCRKYEPYDFSKDLEYF